MATVSAWAKPGAWALDSEENEAIEAMKQQQQQHREKNQFDEFEQQQQQPLSDFPSLATAAIAKPKKKKSQPVSLAEFTTGKQVTHGAGKAQSKAGLTSDELLILPTGPRERSAEELDRSRLGGGFNNYGSGSRRSSSGEDSSNSRWGSSRVSDEPRRNGGYNRDSKDSGPSRADEIDDWGAGKKSAPTTERRERSGGFFDNQSKADESESWVSNKSFVPSEGRRFEGFNKERKGGFDMFQKEVSNGGGDSDSWGKKKEEGGGSGSGSGSGRPRLVLQRRTLPVSNGDQQTPPQPGSAKSKGSNPFGAARPREEVLAEKGQDWKKIDEQLESMKIKEVGSADGPAFGKKSFGSGNGRSLPEDRTERNWRKTTESTDGPPLSTDEADDGVANN